MNPKHRRLPWWAIYNNSKNLERLNIAFLCWRLLITETQSNRIYGWTNLLAMYLNQPNQED